MFNLPVPLVKKAVYGWFLIHGMPILGKRMLDFGPQRALWPDYMSDLGAKVDFCDHDPTVVTRLLRAGYSRIGRPEKGTYDIIVASAAIQHNAEGAAGIYAMLAEGLKADGRIWLAEQTGQATRWWADRPDPCWIRTPADHAALWVGAGLVVEHEAFLSYAYDPDPDKGWVRWCDEGEASVILAILRRAA